jgi:hypothetical protein
LTRGGGSYAGPANRAGFWPARVSPIRAIARVPLSIPLGSRDLSVDRWPGAFVFFASADRRCAAVAGAPAGAEACAEACAPSSAARAAFRATLKLAEGLQQSHRRPPRRFWAHRGEAHRQHLQQARPPAVGLRPPSRPRLPRHMKSARRPRPMAVNVPISATTWPGISCSTWTVRSAGCAKSLSPLHAATSAPPSATATASMKDQRSSLTLAPLLSHAAARPRHPARRS